MIEYENLGLLNKPFFEEFKAAFAATLESGWYILGNKVKEFETTYAQYHGSKHFLGLANGLDALTLSLRAFNFAPGDEVIVPSNTYIATILSVVECGLKPVLVEPDIHTYNIDPAQIEAAITPRTRAIIVVHLYGKSCEMDKIVAIKEKHNLVLIEDCAQSHAATFKGQLTGTFGEFGAFSFYPTKNLGALGDAGGLLCNDDALATTIRRLRNYGSDVKYYNELVGMNSRLDEIQAAFLLVKLQHLAQITEHKRALAAIYQEGIKSDFIKPVVHPDYFDVFHIYNVRHERRDELKQYLLDNGVKTDIHYPLPPDRQKAMQGIIAAQPYPISAEIHRTTLSLPCSYYHTKADIEQVVAVINKF
ncbi:DegT/DnrJ/EryC1/StrS family aminotransferase [Chitinophaga nivalis]|uniref:DegT/DnrJ/EryC1/StrS family aminotransferase n=1 Tax=Chitinophaga nivalis TaxID=2991709 RepID=A0ABT3INP0_9BACT|nr:DegT/DnrJ/EryC1/StrS family aminotransferase [Chitinophaga nivalis]MCW3464711.1 DegT/DnrJ/EryC1/StrS family aminotransferase [Chitinophaga nivalis]MCW3485598.1 DegT/DnrJ/EryC1/StrS family aminotransferase [Chitinophaga nivalis]